VRVPRGPAAAVLKKRKMLSCANIGEKPINFGPECFALPGKLFGGADNLG
jgi:hypothetical protein